MTRQILNPEPLTAAAFAPFGDVIESEGREPLWINAGTCARYDDLAVIDVGESGGRPILSIFEARPRPLPLPIHTLERHPLSSQAFVPLDSRPFLIVVASDGPGAIETRIRAFASSGVQGVNFRRNTWHHPLIAIGTLSRFLVIDRCGPGANCDEWRVTGPELLLSGQQTSCLSFIDPSRTPI
jgi:ureidoglycolate lyase